MKQQNHLLTHPWRSHSHAMVAFCKGIIYFYGWGILPEQFNPVYLHNWVFTFVNFICRPINLKIKPSILISIRFNSAIIWNQWYVQQMKLKAYRFTRYVLKRKYSTFEIVCDASGKLLSLSLTLPVCKMDTLTSLTLRDAIVKAATRVCSPVKLLQVILLKQIAGIVFLLNIYLFTVKNSFTWLLRRIDFTKT